jgi:glyoxylate/succinic semialdehyde reductase
VIMGSVVSALGEGVAVAEKTGLSGAVLGEVLSQGALASPVFAGKLPNMVTGK